MTLILVFTVATQARAQAQQFLFHSENGFDAGMKHKRNDYNFAFSLVLMLAFALQQVKTKHRSGTTQADKDAYHTWLCLANKNTGSRLPRVIGMILLGPVFASNFVFTWIISIACAFACTSPSPCVACENHARFISSKLKAITVIVSYE